MAGSHPPKRSVESASETIGITAIITAIITGGATAPATPDGTPASASADLAALNGTAGGATATLVRISLTATDRPAASWASARCTIIGAKPLPRQ